MKRFAMLFAALGLLVGLPTVASAQTAQATIQVKASIAKACRFQSTTLSDADFGTLDQTNPTDKATSVPFAIMCSVGQVVWTGLDNTGVTATGASLTKDMVHATDATQKIAYTATVPGGLVGAGVNTPVGSQVNFNLLGASYADKKYGSYSGSIILKIEGQ